MAFCSAFHRAVQALGAALILTAILAALILVAPILVAGVATAQAASDRIGQIKTVSGTVTIERDSSPVVAATGMPIFESDRIATGSDGSIGITFRDNTVLSAGPDSKLSFDEYEFDSATLDGKFTSNLDAGTVSIISGDIVKRSPEALKVRTPMAILGVRGTEFVVKVDPDLHPVRR